MAISVAGNTIVVHSINQKRSKSEAKANQQNAVCGIFDDEKSSPSHM
jgi:hypothetical protein